MKTGAADPGLASFEWAAGEAPGKTAQGTQWTAPRELSQRPNPAALQE